MFLLEWGERQQSPYWRVVYSASPGEGFSSGTVVSWFNDLDATVIVCVCLCESVGVHTALYLCDCARVQGAGYVRVFECRSPAGKLSARGLSE